MSVRLFAGYFLVLAACAIVAFGSSEPEPTAPPFTAAAEMMPVNFSAYPAASFSVRSHVPVPKRIRMADAQ